MRETYAELVCHWRVYQPVTRQYDVDLCCHRLWKLQQQTSCLREALCRKEDGFLKILRQRRKGRPAVELLRRGQGIRQVCHASSATDRREMGAPRRLRRPVKAIVSRCSRRHSADRSVDARKSYSGARHFSDSKQLCGRWKATSASSQACDTQRQH